MDILSIMEIIAVILLTAQFLQYKFFHKYAYNLILLQMESQVEFLQMLN